MRPPKRIRTEEHPYNTTWEKKYETRLRWKDSGDPNIYWGTLTSCWGGISGTFSDPWTSNDTIALLGKLRNKVAGSEFNLGVFLAEAPQAIKMIAETATKIDRAYRAARRGNFSRAAAILTKGSKLPRPKDKVVANNWLELQYGWLPLLQDAEASAQFLAHMHEHPQQSVVRARLRRVYPTSDVKTGSPSNVAPLRVERFAIRNIKAILREKDTLALSGLTDPLSVVWEKLPYSFVIDWFIPIGNWLQARTLGSALSGTFVVSHKYWTTVDGLKLLSTYGRTPVSGFDGYYYNRGGFSRTVSTTLEVPVPGLKRLSDVPSWRRMANAVSLLLQKRP